MPKYRYDVHAYEERYRKVYEAGASFWEEPKPTRVLINFLGELSAPKGSKAIDMGCGEGRDSIFLAKKGFDVTGVDASRSGIKRARERAKAEVVDINFLVADVVNLPIKDEMYDLAINIACLQMIMDQHLRDKHLREVHRVLSDGGTYFSCNGAVEKPLSIEEFYKHLGKQPGDLIPRKIKVEGEEREIYLPIIPAWLKSGEEYLEEFEKASFSVIRMYRDTGNDHDWWILVARRVS